jgi:putative ABC transport system permease protein
MKYLPLIWRNLWRRKLNTLFTTLAIFVGFVLFGALVAVRAAFSLGIDVAGADRLVMIHKVSFIQLLPRSYKDRILAVDGVKDITHANWFGGIYQDPSNFIANMAVDSDSFLRMYPEFTVPEDQLTKWKADRTGAIVGVDTMKRFGWKIGDRIPLQSPFYRKPDGTAWEFTIDGVYDSVVKGTDKTQFFFHYAFLEQVLDGTPFEGQVGWYVIRVENPDESAQVAKRIDALFANSPYETKTATEKAFVSDFAKQIGDIGTIVVAIVAVAMFMILIVTANTMAHAIRTRTNELGMLKAVGFTDRLILVMVLLESSAIAIVGGGLGLAVAWAIVAQGDPTNGMLPAWYFPIPALIVGCVLVVLLGIAAGALPAWQASRLRIVEALRRN